MWRAISMPVILPGSSKWARFSPASMSAPAASKRIEVKVEQIRLEVGIEQVERNRIRPADVDMGEEHKIELAIAPFVDMARVVMVLRLNDDLVGLHLDFQRTRMIADLGAQGRDGRLQRLWVRREVRCRGRSGRRRDRQARRHRER